MHITKACFFFLLLLTSCGTSRNLVYFSDLKTNTEAQTLIENDIATRIQQKDLISISVSSLDPESNVLFNSGVLLPAGSPSSAIAADKVNEGYLVNKEGEINFPVIGKISLLGLTVEEATDKMTSLLKSHVKNPIVNIRFLNFRVTVIGEVNNPSTFVVSNESINIMEALGLAGDMTTFGRRENVLIIREEGGIRTTTRINLNDKEVLNSPYFYLQQNDIVYVEPHNRSKVAQTSASNRFIPIVVSAISAFAIYLSTVSR